MATVIICITSYKKGEGWKTSKYYPTWTGAQLVKVNVMASKTLLDTKSLQTPATSEDLFEYVKKETGSTITR